MFPCHRPLALSCGKVDVGCLTCATILVCADYTKARQALTSLHKGRPGKNWKTIVQPVASRNGTLNRTLATHLQTVNGQQARNFCGVSCSVPTQSCTVNSLYRVKARFSNSCTLRTFNSMDRILLTLWVGVVAALHVAIACVFQVLWATVFTVQITRSEMFVRSRHERVICRAHYWAALIRESIKNSIELILGFGKVLSFVEVLVTHPSYWIEDCEIGTLEEAVVCAPSPFPARIRVLWTQKYPLQRTQSYQRYSFSKSSVYQNIAMHTLPGISLSHFLLIPFILLYFPPNPLHTFFSCALVVSASSGFGDESVSSE